MMSKLAMVARTQSQGLSRATSALLTPNCLGRVTQSAWRTASPPSIVAATLIRYFSTLNVAKATVSTSFPSVNAKAMATERGEGRQGDEYLLNEAQVRAFHEKGYIHLQGLLSEEELKPLEDVYMRFMKRQIPVQDKDLCDMSGDYSRKFEDFGIINVMLPRVYYSSLKDNIYEKRVRSVTRQLFGSDEFDIDYDQLLAKKPSKTDAVFAWHCDMAYWPMTPDTRTATFSLAIDPTTKANGCLRFVDGSHKSQTIRPHKPISEDASKSHTIACAVDERTEANPNGELVTYCEVGRGDVTVHNEYVVHGSGGNFTEGWRRTYVIATRPKSTIQIERQAGFTHSHNDNVNWESFNQWVRQK